LKTELQGLQTTVVAIADTDFSPYFPLVKQKDPARLAEYNKNLRIFAGDLAAGRIYGAELISKSGARFVVFRKVGADRILAQMNPDSTYQINLDWDTQGKDVASIRGWNEQIISSPSSSESTIGGLIGTNFNRYESAFLAAQKENGSTPLGLQEFFGHFGMSTDTKTPVVMIPSYELDGEIEVDQATGKVIGKVAYRTSVERSAKLILIPNDASGRTLIEQHQDNGETTFIINMWNLIPDNGSYEVPPVSIVLTPRRGTLGIPTIDWALKKFDHFTADGNRVYKVIHHTTLLEEEHNPAGTIVRQRNRVA
jgi:hypothetical protein